MPRCKRASLVLGGAYFLFVVWGAFFANVDWLDRTGNEGRFLLVPGETIMSLSRDAPEAFRHGFWKEWLINMPGNLVLFVPFVLLAKVAEVRLSLRVAALASFAASLVLEAVQVKSGAGNFDVDDLLLNVLGVIGAHLLAFRGRR